MRAIFKYSAIFAALTISLSAQSSPVFGFFQSHFAYIPEDPISASKPVRYYGATQQLNLFYTNAFDDNLSCFVNLEFINNYNFARNWGNMSLEEVWVKWAPDQLFNVKAGQSIPEFGNFNVIKNRMPFIPYVFRPLVYESNLEQVRIIQISDFVPENAFLQIYGSYLAGTLNLDYAAYLGNAENSFISTEFSRNFTLNRGIDTSKFLTIGGRIGLRYSAPGLGRIKTGVSFAADKDNLTEVYAGDFSSGPVYADFGTLHRNKFAFDLSINALRLVFESEYMVTRYDPGSGVQDSLDAAGALGGKYIGEGFDKLFYYFTLGYNLTDQFFIYGGYSNIEDDLTYSLDEGFTHLNFGAVYSINDNVVIKAQYNQLEDQKSEYEYFTLEPVFLAVSVLF